MCHFSFCTEFSAYPCDGLLSVAPHFLWIESFLWERYLTLRTPLISRETLRLPGKIPTGRCYSLLAFLFPFFAVTPHFICHQNLSRILLFCLSRFFFWYRSLRVRLNERVVKGRCAAIFLLPLSFLLLSVLSCAISYNLDHAFLLCVSFGARVELLFYCLAGSLGILLPLLVTSVLI